MKLKQVIIYPELATYGVILCICLCHEITIPFMLMLNLSHFLLLKFFLPNRTGSMIGNDTKNMQHC